MLQIRNIHKEYTVGSLSQIALNDVSLDFRDNDFVSILGPSGSGKTTLLNIIGGLDRYDSGDLIINGVSTKNYKDRDWDTYRNHTIGFVFQSYNLIAHQSILSNVELALTISGVSKAERKKRAKNALEEVGLKDHIHKKPNQLSGGQMQRVAIARALVNNPDILLADEPTGALDTETSIQIMELLKKVAEKKLVVMVTHNPELAQEYSTRIIKLKDGKVTDDSNEFIAKKVTADASARNGKKQSKMKLLTSLSLSLSNLNTKKKRTLLTSFAGSIGIIGIALILSLSNGVNTYIETLQRDTMSAYPLTISAESMSIPMGGMSPITHNNSKTEVDKDTIYPDFKDLETASNLSITNNLTPFKEYLSDPDSEIQQYIGENGVYYSYDTSFSVYSYDKDDTFINTDTDPSELLENSNPMIGFGDPSSMMAMMGGSTSSGASNFSEMYPGANGEILNTTITDNYALTHGNWPQEYNEIILVTDENNAIPIDTLYQLGFVTDDEYEEYAQLIENDEEVPNITWNYEEMLNKTFYLLTNSDKYVENEDGTFTAIEDAQLIQNEDVMDRAVELKVVGVVAPKDEATSSTIQSTVGYTSLLTDYIIKTSNESPVVVAQDKTPEVNVLTGVEFEAQSDADKAEDVEAFLSELSVSEKADMYTLIMYYASQNETEESTEATQATSPTQMPQGQSGSTAQADDETMAKMLDSWLANSPDEEILLTLYDELLGDVSYAENIKEFGKISYDSPTSINIYTDSFEDKEGVTASIENYNNEASEENKITYVDYVESLMSSMTIMIDTISYVLIAFVAVSLIVSCIMVGIITHISVIERTKEIGVLRALGASKRNISQVFNAETLIIGLCSGLLGVGLTLLINIPLTMIVQALIGSSGVAVSLPVVAMLILVGISVLVTIVGGLLPAKKAAQKDPVLALRSE